MVRQVVCDFGSRCYLANVYLRKVGWKVKERECLQCRECFRQDDEIYRVDDGLVHVDCFHDYAWRILVCTLSFNYDEEEE